MIITSLLALVCRSRAPLRTIRFVSSYLLDELDLAEIEFDVVDPEPIGRPRIVRGAAEAM